jgi:hypothetical protein
VKSSSVASAAAEHQKISFEFQLKIIKLYSKSVRVQERNSCWDCSEGRREILSSSATLNLWTSSMIQCEISSVFWSREVKGSRRNSENSLSLSKMKFESRGKSIRGESAKSS